MANLIINKAGIQPVPTDSYLITGSDVIKYLRDQLGFDLAGYDFTRWTGTETAEFGYVLGYVRMRVVFYADDIVAKKSSKDYIDRVLEQNASGIAFKSSVIDTIKPFMYPESVKDIFAHPEDLEKMARRGIYGERLEELIMNQSLNYCPGANCFRLYLRPERIIEDMLRNPTTNEIDGNFTILKIHGTSSETIRWEVLVNKGRNSIIGDSNISLNTLFGN